MSAQIFYNNGSSSSEIITHLINSTDGTGLHFDGAAGTYVGCGDTTILDGATKISLEVITATSSSSMGALLTKSSAADGINLRFNADGKIFCALNNSSSTVSATTSGTYNDGNPKHIVATWDNATISIYVNGNLDGTATLAGGSIPNTTDRLALGANLNSGGTSSNNFDGILYRARFWNKTLSQAEVTASYENATVPFADQYGSQTNKITGAVDKNWGTAQADTGNDATDRATFNTNYVWNTDGTPTDISVASNVLQFTASVVNSGILYPATLVAGKRYRLTIATGTISGTFKVRTWNGSAYTVAGTLAASTTNNIDFIASASVTNYIYIQATSGGTIQLTAASVTNEYVASGCVSDYDLAFANPTPSLMVQDRAGAADGTSSATGVVQVTKLEQVNSKAISVSNATQRTPANGDIVADQVGVGVVPTELLHLASTGVAKVLINADTDNTGEADNAIMEFRQDGAQSCLWVGVEGEAGQTVSGSAANAAIICTGDGHSGTIPLQFGTNKTIRATISSTGLATFANGIAFQSATTGTGTGTGYTLDSYEYGTWTPVQATGAIAGTTITYAGRYTRIGRSVNLYCKISAGANDLIIGSYVSLSGLPFAAAVNSSGYSSTEDIDLDNGGEVNVGSTSIYFGPTGSATATQTITATLTYQV